MFFYYICLSLIFFFILWVISSLTDELYIKLVSLCFSVFIFIISVFNFLLLDFLKFEVVTSTFEISTKLSLFFTIGVDMISAVFILLTAFIFVIVVLIAWNSIKFKIKMFFCLLFLLEYFILNVFGSFELIFFYFWFESSLIPMFLIILIWGNLTRKTVAAFYLIMYTLIFSTPFFIAIVFIHYKFGSSNVIFLTYSAVLSVSYQKVMFIVFFMAFAVKLPVFPIHIWLPEAHVESPTTGSVILASLLLKLGYYGCLRFCLQCFPEAILFYKPVIAIIGIAGCIYGALLSLSQNDMKKVIAYSSVSHMSVCLLGLFSGNFFGILGSFLMAIGHSFVSSSLFFLVGSLYDRYHTRSLDYFSGLGNYIPIFSFFFFIAVISNFGFPISLNFVSEFFIFVGVGFWNFSVLLFLLFYSVLSVAYNLLLFIKIFHGTLKNYIVKFVVVDLQKRELYILFPLMFCNVFLCFFISNFIKFVTPVILLMSFNA